MNFAVVVVVVVVVVFVVTVVFVIVTVTEFSLFLILFYFISLLFRLIERDGSLVQDLHVWRLGPGHLGAVISLISPREGVSAEYYKQRIKGFKALSHVTIEVNYLSEKQTNRV